MKCYHIIFSVCWQFSWTGELFNLSKALLQYPIYFEKHAQNNDKQFDITKQTIEIEKQKDEDEDDREGN